tara:strand:- start:307 stop:600 length:294 start_codon:yes stop_codon:yes gene_type:complete
MNMIPEIIYVTGGASKNKAIIQTLSDIFQTKVQRLVINGSVALGGAMRAAQHGLNFKIKELEMNFCTSNLEMIQPNKSTEHEYNKATNAIQSMLLTI